MSVESGEGLTLTIDSTRSSIKWRAAKVTRAHDGGFTMWSGTISTQDNMLTGVDVNVDTRSVYTDPDRLTNHLKSDSFFDVEMYPVAIFMADRFEPVDSTGATHLVSGNLSMHGVTHGVTFPATITIREDSILARADFIINRRDWAINYDGAADDLVEDNVRLFLDIAAAVSTGVAEAAEE